VDKTFLEAALRETREEVGILPGQVEILGQVGPPQLSFSGLRVWPYVVRLSVTAVNALTPSYAATTLRRRRRDSCRVSYTPRPSIDTKPVEIKKLRYLHYGWIH
jgi:8-oxo-dGTP pyrophosphatase MutT (NUDIX family)